LIAPPPAAAATATGATSASGMGTDASATAADRSGAVQAPPPQRPPLYKDTVAGTQTPSATPAAAPKAGGVCSGCGAPLPAGARFCTICGTVAG
jgi:hypothetical protein